MAQVGFEPTIPARERQQTHALDHAATGTGDRFIKYTIYKYRGQMNTFNTTETLIDITQRY